jgi:hypothetical protein
VTEKPDRTNMIVGAVVEWTTFGVGGVSAFRGRVLDSQLSDDGKYQLLVEPVRVEEVNGWRVTQEHESRLQTIQATDAHMPEIESGGVVRHGYRARG